MTPEGLELRVLRALARRPRRFVGLDALDVGAATAAERDRALQALARSGLIGTRRRHVDQYRITSDGLRVLEAGP